MDLLSAKQLQIPNFTGPLSLARLCIRAIRRICHPGTLPSLAPPMAKRPVQKRDMEALYLHFFQRFEVRFWRSCSQKHEIWSWKRLTRLALMGRDASVPGWHGLSPNTGVPFSHFATCPAAEEHQNECRWQRHERPLLYAEAIPGKIHFVKFEKIQQQAKLRPELVGRKPTKRFVRASTKNFIGEKCQ